MRAVVGAAMVGKVLEADFCAAAAMVVVVVWL